jgi:TatA/E family protein of Tat protein translocase
VDIFGIGPLELIVILILALLIFGPDRLPEIGAKLGKAMRGMRQATREFSREIEQAREAVEAPAQEIAQPLQEAAQSLDDVKATAAGLATAAQAVRNPPEAIRQSLMRELDKTEEPQAADADQEPPAASAFAPTQEAAIAPAEPAPSTARHDVDAATSATADSGEPQPSATLPLAEPVLAEEDSAAEVGR